MLHAGNAKLSCQLLFFKLFLLFCRSRLLQPAHQGQTFLLRNAKLKLLQLLSTISASANRTSQQHQNKLSLHCEHANQCPGIFSTSPGRLLVGPDLYSNQCPFLQLSRVNHLHLPLVTLPVWALSRTRFGRTARPCTHVRPKPHPKLFAGVHSRAVTWAVREQIGPRAPADWRMGESRQPIAGERV